MYQSEFALICCQCGVPETSYYPSSHRGVFCFEPRNPLVIFHQSPYFKCGTTQCCNVHIETWQTCLNRGRNITDEDFLAFIYHQSLFTPPPLPHPLSFAHDTLTVSWVFFNVACNRFITVLYLHSSLSRFSSARKTYPNHYIISNAIVKLQTSSSWKPFFGGQIFTSQRVGCV